MTRKLNRKKGFMARREKPCTIVYLASRRALNRFRRKAPFLNSFWYKEKEGLNKLYRYNLSWMFGNGHKVLRKRKRKSRLNEIERKRKLLRMKNASKRI